MSLLAVTVDADLSAVVDAVRAVGWYGVDVEVFRNMRPSVVITLDDAEYEEFMRIVESKPVADERLVRLFKRPSPFGQHVELSE